MADEKPNNLPAHQMAMNPYAVRLVIKDPNAFYGRAAEINELYTRLASMQSCSIVGPRRIGKSSLLYYLTHPQVYRQFLPDPDNYVFTFIDLQELTGLGPDDFFDTAVFQLQTTASQPALADMDMDGYTNMRGFRRFLMKCRGAGLKLVLCLDEFEMLSRQERFNVDFFTYLRGLCSNYDLALVTSSRTSLYDLCHQGNLQTSQFWNIFVELGLGVITEPEALSLIQEPFAQAGRRLNDEEVNFVQNWAGQHPFFIQICCYHLFATPAAQATERFMAEASPHFAYAFDQLTPAQQTLLKKLAQGHSMALRGSEFAALQKQAVVAGTAIQPRLLSQGWRRYLTQQMTPPAAPKEAVEPTARPEPIQLPRLRNLLARHFNESELEDLCFDLSVDYEELEGNEKRGKVRSLIGRMEREGRLPDLLAQCQQLRPQISWSDKPASPAPAKPTPAPFADFSLKIEQLDPTSCRVMVLDSPAGQDSMVCQLPFALDAMPQLRLDLGQMVTRGPETAVTGASPARIGQALFETIFTGPIGQLFFESWGEVNNKGQGLRIKLHIDPVQSPQLAALPWEFLYNGRRRRYFSLNQRTPIVRYLDVPAPTSRPRLHPPLRVLVAIAAPEGSPPLDLARERAAIEQSWGSQANVTVKFLVPGTPAALHQQLRHWQPHVLHFMGHGQFDRASGDGELLFVDEANRPRPLNGQQLGNLLANTPTVRLAFLNACETALQATVESLDPFSGVAGALVLAGLPAVVAMQFPITDAAALAFAGGFYGQLAAGTPVDQAVAYGRESLHLTLAGSQEWGTPVLFMRVRDGHVFETA